MTKTKVINLWAGPGAGKSTTAAGLFYKMKLAGHKCELVTEYAKELCYANILSLICPIDILHNQAHRQNRLQGKVDWIITDSPLYLSYIYAPEPYVLEICDEYWDKFDNINFKIKRVKEYKAYGRTQSETEAKLIDDKIAKHLAGFDVKGEVFGNEWAPHEIMRHLGLKHD